MPLCEGIFVLKERCQNMNHGRSNAAVCFCPTCGDKLSSVSRAACNQVKHAARRKDRNAFCHDCGLKLSVIR